MSTTYSDMAANFWRAWWAWLICFVLTIVISLFTAKRPKEELVGLVRGLTPDAKTGSVAFTGTPEFWAIISLVVLVILNVYFW
jgi:SSS family solute:Na+ symporter